MKSRGGTGRALPLRRRGGACGTRRSSCPVQTMDPEVTLLLQCPGGGLPQEQIQAELSPAHDRRPLPCGEEAITAIWETRLKAQPWLFDAPKFRLHSATLAPIGSRGPQLLLRLGLTSYRDFLGTNWSSSAAWLRQQGATDWGDTQAYLADPLGVGAALATADDFLVFLRRSWQVAEAPGLVDVPGGHPEPQALCPGGSPQHEDLAEELVVRELFSSVLQEICDEVNLPLLTLSQPLLLGIARNETSAGRASAEFYVQCSLTSEQVRKHYLSGGPEAHESTGIIFVETQVDVVLASTPMRVRGRGLNRRRKWRRPRVCEQRGRGLVVAPPSPGPKIPGWERGLGVPGWVARPRSQRGEGLRMPGSEEGADPRTRGSGPGQEPPPPRACFSLPSQNTGPGPFPLPPGA
ncbi:uridine diphosphate glucose pyrophosphatase NUDT22 isoform X2 [Pongo abelii]|uniref:uridine diphosphate glucose pyrophosphatase NUDT22 isoform X2 n=1 Tax=Pongo abelii TaxID=9601 RepID=UPI0023E81DF8|nr:uridine diphosphate glucose pyrophosphatase NUDT22 isoform X1 [Pongo abelii]